MDTQNNFTNPLESNIQPPSPTTTPPIVETQQTVTIPPISETQQASTTTLIPSVGDFNVSEAISYGWNMSRKHYGKFIKISIPLVITYVLSFVFSLIFKQEDGFKPGSFEYGIESGLGVLLFIFQYLVASSAIILSLMIVDDKLTEGKNIPIFLGKDVALHYFIASIIYSIKVSLWSLLFIIPGTYISIKHHFTPWVAIDRNTYRDAYSNSGELSKGVMLKIVGLISLLGLINFAGFLAIGFGLIITIPLGYLSTAYVYRLIAGKKFVVESTPVNPISATV